MAAKETIFVVEPDTAQARLIAVAIERVRPGSVVAFGSFEEAADGAAPPPRLVILGASTSIDGADALAGLRAALPGVPLVALVAPDHGHADGVDAAYAQPLEWRALCSVVEELLEDWLAR